MPFRQISEHALSVAIGCVCVMHAVQPNDNVCIFVIVVITA